MGMTERQRHLLRQWFTYESFEKIISRILMVLVGLIILYSLVLLLIALAAELWSGSELTDSEVLSQIFGSILTILILLEFNHSIALSITKRSGVIQVRIVVLIAILVIARKLILLDYHTVGAETLLGLGGLGLMMGGLYWLLNEGDRRGAATGQPRD